MKRTLNVEANPNVAIISYPSNYVRSVVWMIRRVLGNTLDSDTADVVGSKDQDLIISAIRAKRWWAFAGGAFHFGVSDIPLSTTMSLALLGVGTVVPEAPEVLKFRAAVSPIAMTNSAVFTLATEIDRLAKLHDDMQAGGIPAHQLQELLLLGSVVDFEYALTGAELLRLCEIVLLQGDNYRSDVMMPELVEELLSRATDVCPDIFFLAKEIFNEQRK